MAKDKDILSDGLEEFKLASDADSHNRESYRDDIAFGRLGEQWDEQDKRKRKNRPCLTINRCPSFARQVVNEARQNKISIKVRPVDDNADVETAEVMNGLIRNIEHSSNADAAYDTSASCAVEGGFGYFRITLDYAHDDSFDKDLRIKAIPNPLTVYGDPWSMESDSADWNTAFITESMRRSEFEEKYKDADPVDWDGEKALEQWCDKDNVQVAEWWKREEVPRTIVRLSDGMIIGKDEYQANKEMFDAIGMSVVGERVTRSYKVTQRIMTGKEVLEQTAWAGCYIPIVPVYGDVIIHEGKRYLRSLIHDAKDAQRMFNYFRSVAAEVAALSPKAPYIGHEGAFNGEYADRWETANTEPHPFLAVPNGMEIPQRQFYSGPAAAAVTESLSASDDMKSIMGIYDASLGQRSNETSGRAIAARQRESDTGTFHFVDNLARAVRHGGRILLDMIPLVYTPGRIIRVLGNDGTAQNVNIGEKNAQQDQQMVEGQAEQGPTEYKPGSPLNGVYDLSAGKYDLAVDVGPAYATQRQEAADQMMQLLQSFPDAAPIIGDLVAKNLDWPGADEIAERLKSLLPPQINDGIPPAITQKLQEYEATMTQLMAENQALKQQAENEQGKNALEQDKLKLEHRKLDVEETQINAEAMQAKAESLKALNEAQSAEGVMAAAQQLMAAAQAITAVPANLNAEMLALRQEVARPRVKKGRAAKQADGSFIVEAVEE